MARRRYLPPYVSVFKDRHGKDRFRFRRKGYPSGYFKSALGTEGFRVELAAFNAGSGADEAISRATPGTIDDLVTRYFAVPSRLGPTLPTQTKVRAIIGKFRDEYGAGPVARVTFEHIDTIIGKKLERTMVTTDRGMRPAGGPEAARKLRKELVRLFDFAVKLRMISVNPVGQADRVKVARGERSKGYHTWTESEISQFRKHFKLGSKPRLAMELMLWTGQRRVDAIRMGPSNILNGRLDFSQSKTGTDLSIPVAPQLQEAINAIPPHDGPCYLVTEYGRPFSNPGFGNWFREQCDSAGLPQCTAHGLRKATMRRMAELGRSNQSLKSISGHVNDEEVAGYTRAVDQSRMATDAIDALAEWELSNLEKTLDSSSPAGIEKS